jgi:uncharacterized membrane protein
MSNSRGELNMDLPAIYSRSKNWIDNIRSSFWAIPCSMITLSILLALLTVWVDSRLSRVFVMEHLGWSRISGIEGMRGALATTAAAILGAAGVSFSITIASLTLASQQFGPRLIRNFMRDRFIQTVLGFFAATFVYCMVTMLLSDIFASSTYTPVSTLAVTLTLIIVDLVLLILFLHHICVSIQVETVIADIFKALVAQLESQSKIDVPSTDDQQQRAKLADSLLQSTDHLTSDRDGYLRYIDYDGLIVFAEKNKLLMRVNVRAGDYVFSGQVLCEYTGESGHLSRQVNHKKFFVIDEARTQLQDLEYSIRQLVEIALRALSPGVNDPFTAMTCIDRLGSVLNRIAHSRLPSEVLVDSNNTPRLIRKCYDFPALVELAFNQVRQSAASHTDITIKLLETIHLLAQLVPDPKQCSPLRLQAGMLMKNLHDNSHSPMDYDAIQRRYQALVQTIDSRRNNLNHA